MPLPPNPPDVAPARPRPTRRRPTRRRPARRNRLAIVASAVVLVLLLVPLSGCTKGSPTFVVYGDSLLAESEPFLRARLAEMLPGHEIVIRASAGTAICDHFFEMQDDADHLDVRGVALVFWGNYGTPCITRRPFMQGTADDINASINFWSERSVPIMLTASPGRVGHSRLERQAWGLGGGNIYAYVGALRGVPVVDASSLFIDAATGTYSEFAPCLVGECTGMARVRSVDGIHFCTDLYTSTCATEYSSGVVRFATTITYGVAAIMHRPQPVWLRMVDPVPAPPPSTTTTTTTAATAASSTSTTTVTSRKKSTTTSTTSVPVERPAVTVAPTDG